MSEVPLYRFPPWKLLFRSQGAREGGRERKRWREGAGAREGGRDGGREYLRHSLRVHFRNLHVRVPPLLHVRVHRRALAPTEERVSGTAETTVHCAQS